MHQLLVATAQTPLIYIIHWALCRAMTFCWLPLGQQIVGCVLTLITFGGNKFYSILFCWLHKFKVQLCTSYSWPSNPEGGGSGIAGKNKMCQVFTFRFSGQCRVNAEFLLLHQNVAKRPRGRAVSAPDFGSRGHGFESRWRRDSSRT